MPASSHRCGRRSSRVGAKITAIPRQRHQNAIDRSLVEPNGNGAPAITKNRMKVAGMLHDQRILNQTMLGGRRRIVMSCELCSSLEEAIDRIDLQIDVEA